MAPLRPMAGDRVGEGQVDQPLDIELMKLAVEDRLELSFGLVDPETVPRLPLLCRVPFIAPEAM